jgi:uncharacterized protein YuzE
MHDKYLEVTFRKGKPIAAYLYLSRQNNAQSARTKRFKAGIIVDFDEKDNAIGIEITAPNKIKNHEINEVFQLLHIPPFSEEELAPLKAA